MVAELINISILVSSASGQHHIVLFFAYMLYYESQMMAMI